MVSRLSTCSPAFIAKIQQQQQINEIIHFFLHNSCRLKVFFRKIIGFHVQLSSKHLLAVFVLPPTPTPLFLRRFFLRGSIMSHNTQRRELFLRRPSTYLSLWLPSASLSLWLPSASLSLWLPSASLSLWLPSASLSLCYLLPL